MQISTLTSESAVNHGVTEGGECLFCGGELSWGKGVGFLVLADEAGNMWSCS